MYLFHLYLLLLFSIRPCLCHTDYIEVDGSGDEFDWDGSGELDVDTSDSVSKEIGNDSTTEAIMENTTTNITIDEALAAETKVEELSAVLKTTIHRIRQQYKKMDIVFLIDSSSSVGKSNFRSELRFVIKFLSDFNVSYNYTRVSIVTFSSQEKIVCQKQFISHKIEMYIFNYFFSLHYIPWKMQVPHVDHISEADSDNDKCKLLNFQLPAIDFSGGGTHTANALKQAEVGFSNDPE